MRKLAFLILLLLTVSACESGEPDQSSLPVSVPVDSAPKTNEPAPQKEEPKLAAPSKVTIYTMYGMPQAFPNLEIFRVNPGAAIPEFEELHLVPDGRFDSMNDKVDRDMANVGLEDFSFYLPDEIADFSGRMEVYYDGKKSKMACRFNVVNGKIDGPVKLEDPKGKALFLRN